MAELHPALKGKSQEEIDKICDDLEDQLKKNFYNTNGWRSSRDQNEAIEKVAEVIADSTPYDFAPMLKAVADGDKEALWNIVKEMADAGIESVVDRVIYPRNPRQEFLL